MKKAIAVILIGSVLPVSAGTLTATYGNEFELKAVQAYTGYYGYQPTVNGGQNPESPGDFTIRKMQDRLLEPINDFYGQEFAKTAPKFTPVVDSEDLQIELQ